MGRDEGSMAEGEPGTMVGRTSPCWRHSLRVGTILDLVIWASFVTSLLQSPSTVTSKSFSHHTFLSISE